MPLERGLVEVYTGDGKGKTTAALGLAVRAAGHGLRVLIIHFMKGRPDSGEWLALRRLDNIEVRRFGRVGFVDLRDPDPLDVAEAQRGMEAALDAVASGRYDLVVLDEINVAVHYGLVRLEQLLEALTLRRPHVELVLTGRGADPEVVKRADLVTEMRATKHPFGDGVSAREGIEY